MKSMNVVIILWLTAIWQVGLSANILVHKMLQKDKIRRINSELGEIKNFTDKEINYIDSFQNSECYNDTDKNCTVHDAEKRKCVCIEGYIMFRDGRCQECDCSIAAGFWKNKNNFFNHNGKCVDCECGVIGDSSQSIWCEIRDGEKVCECPVFQSQNGGKCVDCECGDSGQSIGCEFRNGEKFCNCPDLQFQKGYRCLECDCGSNGICSFNEDGIKLCTCKESFAEKIGECVACNCGQNASCTFTLRRNSYEKSCICPEGYQEVNNRCEEIESTTAIGMMSTVTVTFPETTESIQGSTASYTSAPDECDPGKCLHGTCEIIGKSYICKCEEGFIGKHCDVRKTEIPGYDYLWIVYVALFNVSFIFLIASACLYCKSKETKKQFHVVVI